VAFGILRLGKVQSRNRDILSGGGFGLEEARPSIEIVHNIRMARPKGLVWEYHPFAARVGE